MKLIKARHYIIIHRICKHEASQNRNDAKQSKNYYRNTFPEYINNIFHCYCNKKKQININLKWLNGSYPGFKTYFTEKKEIKTSTCKQVKYK